MNIDKKIINRLSYGIEIEKQPFKNIANALGISENELLERIRALIKNGIIRFFRPRIDYKMIGYKSLMVGFYIEKERIREIALSLKSFDIVSHCYIRKENPLFPYNLFLILHAKNKSELLSFVKERVREYGILKHTILFTKREFKGVRPRINLN